VYAPNPSAAGAAGSAVSFGVCAWGASPCADSGGGAVSGAAGAGSIAPVAGSDTPRSGVAGSAVAATSCSGAGAGAATSCSGAGAGRVASASRKAVAVAASPAASAWSASAVQRARCASGWPAAAALPVATVGPVGAGSHSGVSATGRAGASGWPPFGSVTRSTCTAGPVGVCTTVPSSTVPARVVTTRTPGVCGPRSPCTVLLPPASTPPVSAPAAALSTTAPGSIRFRRLAIVRNPWLRISWPASVAPSLAAPRSAPFAAPATIARLASCCASGRVSNCSATLPGVIASSAAIGRAATSG
jgi:hypothetical protein